MAKIFYKNPSDCNDNNLYSQASKCTNLILQAKAENIAKTSAKLDDPKLAPKTYWSIVSRFLTKKKTATIPPVLVNRKLISDIQVKTKQFDSQFATQCTPAKTSSKLPKLKYETKKRLNSFATNEDNIFLIIKNLDVNKAHGWDNISIRMIKLRKP